jgi:pilus assembly protein CpaE
VELLSAPIQPERVETPPREEVRAVLNFLRQHYDFIVVDTSQSFSPSTVAALEAADQVLLVTTPDLPALRNAKRCLPLLQRYGNGKEGGIQLLVNRYAQENAISLEDISRTLDLAISWSLSSDYHAISEAVNKGEPVVLDGRSRYARDLRKMGAELVGLRDAESGRSAGPLAGITAPLRSAWLRFFPTSSSS